MTTPSETATGRDAFGPLIAAELARDPHRPDSVDAVLLDRQVRLTAWSHAALYAVPDDPPRYQPGSRPELERHLRDALGEAFHPVQIAAALTRFCARLSDRSDTDPLFGGTEEQIIERGSSTAAERARLLGALAQAAGLHARVVFLMRTDPVERHAVTEILLPRQWCVFDGYSGRYFARLKSLYASAWDIQRRPELVDHHPDHGRQRYIDSAYYRHAGIAAYDIADQAKFEYPIDR